MKLINRIPGSRLLISSLPGSTLRTHVESLGKPRDVNKRSQPCLVNLITKDTNLVFSISRQASRCQQAFSTLPGKLDIKRHKPSLLYISASLAMSTSVLEALPGKLDNKYEPSILYISASIARDVSLGTYDFKSGSYRRRRQLLPFP